ncbi:hypothetical protein BJ741DRAFT_703475 [Chytriomyces cf. hyalinus JEL632]|nr:hypothetical protein BJ741DRAFT_703475 [Chytriomyces cf. hyalinus JEL632]
MPATVKNTSAKTTMFPSATSLSLAPPKQTNAESLEDQNRVDYACSAASDTSKSFTYQQTMTSSALEFLSKKWSLWLEFRHIKWGVRSSIIENKYHKMNSSTTSTTTKPSMFPRAHTLSMSSRHATSKQATTAEMRAESKSSAAAASECSESNKLSKKSITSQQPITTRTIFVGNKVI